MTTVDHADRAAARHAWATSHSAATVTAIADSLTPISLANVMDIASLQTRTDHKYLLTAEQFTGLIDQVHPNLQALQIAGQRVFGYESVYFDTTDLALFRAHRQGRRRRYKVRTRSYLDSQQTLFEVKLKGNRGRNIKHRLPYDFQNRYEMDTAAHAHVESVLHNEYNMRTPKLRPTLVTRYGRSTFVDPYGAARLTCDVDLTCSDFATTRGGPDAVLVESKSSGGSAQADRVLSEMGIRPISISKYCIGTALLHPQLPANKWNRLLRHRFGWVREMHTS